MNENQSSLDPAVYAGSRFAGQQPAGKVIYDAIGESLRKEAAAKDYENAKQAQVIGTGAANAVEPVYTVRLTPSAIRRLARVSPEANRKLRQQAPQAFIGDPVEFVGLSGATLELRHMVGVRNNVVVVSPQGETLVSVDGHHGAYDPDGFSGPSLHLDSSFAWEMLPDSSGVGQRLTARRIL